MTKLLSLIVSILSIPVFAGAASAALFYFNDSNTFGEWQGTVPPGYGSIEITETSTGLAFVVSANTAFFSSTTEPGLTWDAFFFNLSGSKTFQTSDNTLSEAGNRSISYDQNRAIYGTFEFLLGGNSIGNNEVNPLEFSTFAGLSVSDVALTNADGWMFDGHLKRFDAMTDLQGNQNVTSTWLSFGDSPAPVPEPAIMLLFGTGLVGIAGAVNRKRKQDSLNQQYQGRVRNQRSGAFYPPRTSLPAGHPYQPR